MSDTSNLRPGEVVRGIPVHDPLLDGRARVHTDRQSTAYKLGRCIGALENIVRLIEDPIRCTAGYAPEQIQELTQVVITARNCLKAIGHERRS